LLSGFYITEKGNKSVFKEIPKGFKRCLVPDTIMCSFNSNLKEYNQGAARLGMAWRGSARQGEARHGLARQGEARPGMAWRGGAGQGKVLLSIGNRPGESDLIWIKQST